MPELKIFRTYDMLTSWGKINHDSIIAPEIRRQELQWSKVMMGRRFEASYCGPNGNFGGLGIIGRDSIAGTDIV